MSKLKIAVLLGSNRSSSFSMKLAKALEARASDRFSFEYLDTESLGFYNQDLDSPGRTPQSWLDFRGKIKESDGLIFVTPEYNRGVPAALKNAVDIGSRPYTDNSWNDKPAAVVSQSAGKLGGYASNHSLRQSLACLNVYVMPQPEIYIGEVHTLFDSEGNIIQESTSDFFQLIMDSFEAWVDRFTS